MGTFASRAAIAANAWTPIGTVTANKSAAVNINLANTSTENIEVRLAFSAAPAGDPAAGETIEPGHVIAPKKLLKLTGEPMIGGETVKVWASAAGIDVRFSGFEK